ncbi:UNVERIFIED_CONTAM: hypothetical protein Sradi_5683700 [Sesamum radiatum]|uniref:DUF4283 domain-containing protein n=1 Tax=Sesamum radiatum TaxID=300843 RepID=A0AAW2L208_SESRA
MVGSRNGSREMAKEPSIMGVGTGKPDSKQSGTAAQIFLVRSVKTSLNPLKTPDILKENRATDGRKHSQFKCLSVGIIVRLMKNLNPAGTEASEDGELISPRAAKKVFSSDETLEFLGKARLHRGTRAINFTAKETAMLAVSFKFALIGKFSHGYPSMQSIRTYFSRLGLRGAYSIGVINVKHILIKLGNEEDYSRLWIKQILFLDGFPHRVFKWTPDFLVSNRL